MTRSIIAICCILFVQTVFAGVEKTAAGYYYPNITSQEIFDRVLIKTPAAEKAVRIDFVTKITKSQLAAPESPKFVVYAKGENAEKLIIMAIDDDIFKTLFRVRAVLAQITSNLRANKFLAAQNLQQAGTFFDLLQLMHFKTLVVSDG